jgi:hypothetical protein
MLWQDGYFFSTFQQYWQILIWPRTMHMRTPRNTPSSVLYRRFGNVLPKSRWVHTVCDFHGYIIKKILDLVGNCKSCSEPKRKVLSYFRAFNWKSSRIWIVEHTANTTGNCWLYFNNTHSRKKLQCVRCYSTDFWLGFLAKFCFSRISRK